VFDFITGTLKIDPDEVNETRFPQTAKWIRHCYNCPKNHKIVYDLEKKKYVFTSYGYFIESWGRGTLKMAELTQQAGLPHPEIEEGPDLVLVRFRPSRYISPQQVKQDLMERQRKILQLLSERSGIGRKDILTILNLELRPLKTDLEDLKRLGLIVQIGKGRGSVWYLVESAVNRQ
jgi:predicted HTH transcriptional regulator